MNDYKLQRYNRIKQLSRVALGLQQIKYHPIVNIVWLLHIIGIAILIDVEKLILNSYKDFAIKKQLIDITIHTINIIIPLVLIFATLNFIGEVTAKRDEADICIVFENIRNIEKQPPILIKKKYDKKHKIIIREFYTFIPMNLWQEKKEAICDRMNIHLIGDITYGGRKKNRGNHIYFKSAKGRNINERGVLYDDTL